MTEKIYIRIAQFALVTLALSACTTVPEQLQGVYPVLSSTPRTTKIQPVSKSSPVNWANT